MNLSEVGEIADKYWKTIPKHFPFVLLDEFVVMPNHIHGIIQINNPNDLRYKNINQDRIETPGRDAINRVSTISNKSGGITGNKNPMFHNNLSRIMRWYKGRVSFETHRIHPDFAWQSRFYDHVIRNNESFIKIRYYICSNLKNWPTDQMNPEKQEFKRYELKRFLKKA